MTNVSQIDAGAENNTVEAAPIAKGKSVRATSLKVGTQYVMTTWTKPAKTDAIVTFLGFNSTTAETAEIPQLKRLTVDDKFYFGSGETQLVADGRVPGNVFIGEGAGHRVTFFELGGAAPAAEVTEEAPVATEEAAVPQGWSEVEV